MYLVELSATFTVLCGCKPSPGFVLGCSRGAGTRRILWPRHARSRSPNPAIVAGRPIGSRGAGRLAGEMRWRVAALIAVLGVAAIPGSSGAAQPVGAPAVHVSVKSVSASPTTHFRISFTAVQAAGALGGGNVYRITASGRSAGAGKCVARTAVVAPATLTGAIVRATLAPAGHKRWRLGAFRGQVWSLLLPPCPAGHACPAILPPSRMVGRFVFRVLHG
jgi:hypothetical protein